MITIAKEIQIQRSPTEVFAFIDDESNSPKWMQQCVSLQRVSPGPKDVGTKLEYRYRSMGHEGTMEGAITEYQPGQRLAMQFGDKYFDLAVRFAFEAAAAGTILRQQNEIELKGMAKMMAPMIEKAVQPQLEADLAKLKQ